jgi:hypothetical protein
MYLMPAGKSLDAWVQSLTGQANVIGQVRLHGRVIRETPDWAGALAGEFRAAGVSLHGPQHLSLGQAHLAEALSERYGLPFTARKTLHDRPPGELREMLAGAHLYGLKVDEAYLDSLPSLKQQRQYLGMLVLGLDGDTVKMMLPCPNRTVA